MCALHTRLSGFSLSSGADPGFFLGGGALVSCSTSTPVNHIVFFCRIPVVLKNRRSSRGWGWGAHPLHPPPRSAPVVQQLDHGIPVKSALFRLCFTNGSEEFSEFPRIAANQTINVKLLPINSRGSSFKLTSWGRQRWSFLEGEKLCLICLFPRTKTRASKLSKFAGRLTSFFKYPVKRLFAGCKGGNNVFLVLLDPLKTTS